MNFELCGSNNIYCNYIFHRSKMGNINNEKNIELYTYLYNKCENKIQLQYNFIYFIEKILRHRMVR